jgi:hypothetical protein
MTISRIARGAGAVMLVLAGWAAVMLVLPFVGPTGRQVAVVGPPSAAVRSVLAAGGLIVEVRQGVVLARSDRPGFAAALYRAGAPLVLEGRLAAGCGASLSAGA